MKHPKKIFKFSILLSFCALSFLMLLMNSVTATENNDKNSDKARELIERVEEMYRANSSRAELTMRIETPRYQRSMSMQSLSLGDEKALIRILSPRKDRGISTLKLDNQMWNYFPKINKVIKVPPSMMMGSWMGSDFTNDDLVKETKLVEEYNLSLVEDDAQYLVTLLLPLEESFYDERGRKIRVLYFKEPKSFDGTILPSVLEMIPLNKEGHKTLVIYDSLELDVKDVEEKSFSLGTLRQKIR